MNGICHGIHVEDGDAQLSSPAQQPDSDLSVLSPPRSGLQRMGSISHLLQSNREYILPFAVLKSATPPPASVTPSPMPTLNATILYLSNSSALFCAQLGHAWSTISNFRRFKDVASDGPSTLSHLSFLLQWIFPPSDTRSRAPILESPMPDNPRYHNTDDLVTDFLLRIAKRLPLKHATTWLYTAYMMAQHECKSGIGRIPQVSDAPIV